MKFYKLTPSIAAKLRSLNLTGSEWKVWSYLATAAPFTNTYQKFELLSLLAECQVSKATFYRAIAKLQEAEIIDVQASELSVKFSADVTSLNPETAVSDLRQLSQSCDNSLKSETTFSDLRQLSQSCENQPLEPVIQKPPTLPQINKINKIIQTSSEAEIFEELNNFSMQLMRVGIRVQVYRNDTLVFNPALKTVAIFLRETPKEIRSLAIRQFLGWIENKRNIQDIYAMFYTSIKNFIERES